MRNMRLHYDLESTHSLPFQHVQLAEDFENHPKFDIPNVNRRPPGVQVRYRERSCIIFQFRSVPGRNKRKDYSQKST